jgi:glycosyltransferase involved in cell wall biosynthesis
MKPLPDECGAVLQLTSMVSTKFGGLEKYFVELARVCRLKRYRTVIQYETPPASAAYLRELTEQSATVTVCKTTGPSPRSVLNILALLRSHRPRVIQTHFVSGYALLAVACFARGLGTRRLIALEHSPLESWCTAHRRFAYRRFEHVLGVSEAVSTTLLDAGVPAALVSTHYLGLIGHREASRDERIRLRKTWGIPEHALVIGCIGHEAPVKGLDILLHALKDVIGTRQEIHAVIIGVDPLRSELSRMASSLGLNHRIHWTGVQDEGWRALHAADLYVQPSLSEGIGLAILEAMALKLPVVASRVGGIPEAVVDGTTGYLVEPGSVGSLADGLMRSFRDPERMRAMGGMGYRRYLHLFQGERSVEALVARYFARATSVEMGSFHEPGHP